VFVRYILDRTIRGAPQIRQELGLTCLGALPRNRGEAEPPRTRRDEVVDAPFSPCTHALRSVKVSLDIARRGQALRRIGVLSVLPGEGTSTVALGLGALFAMSGTKTLLMDCDFRNPSLSRTLAPGVTAGLVEALSQQNENFTLFDRKTRAHVLALTGESNVANSADILGSTAMEDLLGRLSTTFGIILLDLPALTSVVDARAVGPLLDGCIIVAEWGRAPLDALKDSIELLAAGNVLLLGVVLNKVDKGVPPLFGIGLDTLRKTDWIAHANGLGKRAAQLTSRLTSRLSSR
jgi:succinoglycan biosynthesis transport protein ExoP